MEEAELLQRMGFTFKDLNMVYGGVYMGCYGFLIIKRFQLNQCKASISLQAR